MSDPNNAAMLPLYSLTIFMKVVNMNVQLCSERAVEGDWITLPIGTAFCIAFPRSL